MKFPVSIYEDSKNESELYLILVVIKMNQLDSKLPSCYAMRTQFTLFP